MNSTYKNLPGLLAVVCGAVILSISLSCKKKPEPNLSDTMRDAYGATSELYRLTWAPDEFEDPSNEARITELLERLIKDSKQAHTLAEDRAFEPGFEVTLEIQQAQLEDIRKRFVIGAKDYANWRLRGLTGNCISCHSRYSVAGDFTGFAPSGDQASFESQLAAAEFLMASRQFDKASAAFFELAKDFGASEENLSDAFRALKMWLVVEVRVKNRPKEALQQLEGLLDSITLTFYYEELVKAWISDLRALAFSRDGETNSLAEARELLSPLINDATVRDDEYHLVTTLRASSLLHQLLEASTSRKQRREATFLLSVAYVHMPISTFEIYREMYLQQCIREFPHTAEARKAYLLYELIVESDSSGSGGLHLEPEQEKELKLLKELAFGPRPERQIRNR